MFLNIALGLGAITLVQAAGYFFKLNKNLVTGACTLIIMAGIWFGIKAAREEAIRETPSRSGIELGYPSSNSQSESPQTPRVKS
jgi:hypothetical protein